MKEHFTLVSPDANIALRTIAESDLENLRQWKNANRFAFFFQDVVTPEQQTAWFQGYLERSKDYMFIVQSEKRSIGCMGFRLLDNQADIYNVILGNPEMGGKGLMSKAMRLMCSYIAADFSQDISAQVLRSNPAIGWYRKNGFRESAAHDTYVEVKLDLTQFRPYPFEKV